MALVGNEYVRIMVIRVQQRMSIFANRWVVISILVSVTLQMLIIYTPAAGLFDAVPLGVGPWLILLGILSVTFAAAMGMTKVVTRAFGAI